MFKNLAIAIVLVLIAIVCVPLIFGSRSTAAVAATTAPQIELYSASYCGECLRAKTYIVAGGAFP